MTHPTETTPAPQCDCDRWQELLVPYLDEELPLQERPALEAHLAQCLACSAELDAHRQVAALLFVDRGRARRPASLLRPAPGDAELAQRARRRGRTGALRRAFAGIAALVAIAAGLTLAGAPWAARAPDNPPDELLGALEVLEALDAAGLEPTAELAQTLEDLSDDSDVIDGGDGLWAPLSEESL